jgi:hypothetical protein
MAGPFYINGIVVDLNQIMIRELYWTPNPFLKNTERLAISQPS